MTIYMNFSDAVRCAVPPEGSGARARGAALAVLVRKRDRRRPCLDMAPSLSWRGPRQVWTAV